MSSEEPPGETTQGRETTPGRETTGVMPAGGRADIDRLYADIEKQRDQLGLTEPNQTQIDRAPTQAMASPIKDPSCRPAQNDTCKTSCTLGSSICDNASRICEIAKTLPGDNEATNKCARANTTCSAASEKCCKCR